MTIVGQVLEVARAEIGYIGHTVNAKLYEPTAYPDVPGRLPRGKFNKYAYELDKTDIFNGPKNGADWCAVFACWDVFKVVGVDNFHKITGIPSRSAAAGVRYLGQYFQQKGWFYQTPQPGDFICYRNGTYWQHTGIVETFDGVWLTTIEGNSGTPLGVHRFRNKLSSISVWGFCRPQYQLIETVQPATPAQPAVQPTPEVEGEMTDAEFNKRVKNYLDAHGQEIFNMLNEAYRKDLQKKDGSDWSKADREWAVQKGLFAGSNGNFMWQDFVTREQAATLFHKYDERR